MPLVIFFTTFLIMYVIIGVLEEFYEYLKQQRYNNVTYTTKERRLKDDRTK